MYSWADARLDEGHDAAVDEETCGCHFAGEGRSKRAMYMILNYSVASAVRGTRIMYRRHTTQADTVIPNQTRRAQRAQETRNLVPLANVVPAVTRPGTSVLSQQSSAYLLLPSPHHQALYPAMAKLTIIATGRVTEAGEADLRQHLLDAQTKALQEPGTETYVSECFPPSPLESMLDIVAQCTYQTRIRAPSLSTRSMRTMPPTKRTGPARRLATSLSG